MCEFDNLENVLIANPFTRAGETALRKLKVQLTEDEFLNSIYADPFISLSDEPEDDRDTDPDIEDMQHLEDQRKSNLILLKENKEKFEKELRSLVETVFVVEGCAGCGKTTYLHWLQREIENDRNIKMKVHIWDLEGYNQDFSILGHPIHIDNKDNVWLFAAILLRRIEKFVAKYSCLSEEFYDKMSYKDIEKQCDYISKLCDIYGDYFVKLIHNRNNLLDNEKAIFFFSILHKANNSWRYKEVGEWLVTEMNEIQSSKNDAWKSDLIRFLTIILIRLSVCDSILLKQKHVYVIDNIESYLPLTNAVTYIRDYDIKAVTNGICRAVRDSRDKIDLINQELQTTFYGFLLSARESTSKLVERTLQEIDRHITKICISDWYCAKDIYERKVMYEPFNNIIQESSLDELKKAHKFMMSDITVSKWGLLNQVNAMYGHDFRRIAINVTQALSKKSKIVTEYNRLWEAIKSDSNGEHVGLVKHMCRKMLFRCMLDHIQSKHYFKDIKVYNESQGSSHKDVNAYARKIVTILHRYQLLHPNSYMSFPSLMRCMFVKPYFGDKPIAERKVKALSQILFHMAKPEIETHWNALIIIKFENEKKAFTENSLLKTMIDVYNNGSNEEDAVQQNSGDTKYGVKITESGSFFAKFLADFEYFACRFASQYPPLPCQSNSQKKGDTYDCINIIRSVRKKAFDCIDDVIRADGDFYGCPSQSDTGNRFSRMYSDDEPSPVYKETSNSRIKCHPLRVLEAHIGYLEHYCKYLRESDPKIDSDCIEGVNFELTKYKEKLNSYKLSYPEYFNLPI
jgi:hypothetical protein